MEEKVATFLRNRWQLSPEYARESVRKVLRRGGGLKMYWTEPAAEEFLYGY